MTAQLSLRIVPDQDLDTIVKSLCDHLNNSFQELQSPNKIQVFPYISPSGHVVLMNTIQINVEHTADWWLGNLDDPWFKALEGAVQEEWGVEPLRIREGGVSQCVAPVIVLAADTLAPSLFLLSRSSKKNSDVMPCIFPWARAL